MQNCKPQTNKETASVTGLLYKFTQATYTNWCHVFVNS